MKFAITGLAKSGKTTLFNLLTGSELETGKFAATREEVHHGVAHVPEPRLERLAEIFGCAEKHEATVEFLDFAGLSLGGERESKLLGDLRTVDAVVHVLRAFDDPELPHPHPDGSVDPARDAAAQESEMILNDLIVVENRLERLASQIARARSEELVREQELVERVKGALEAERPLRGEEFSAEEETILRGYGFLSAKPLLLALNVGEDEASDLESAPERWWKGGGGGLEQLSQQPRVRACALSAQLELEISRLEPEDRGEFLRELGIGDLGRERLLRAAYDLLGLISFFTGTEKETRAWALAEGGSALEAAGTVHSDMARGFIRAEVIAFGDLDDAGSFAEARKLGTLRVESRDYVVRDGEVILVRFNV